MFAFIFRLELLSSELQEHRKVVDFFGDIRMKESETKCQGEYHEKAMALLGDPQNFWTYGDRGKELESLYDQVKDGKIAMVRKALNLMFTSFLSWGEHCMILFIVSFCLRY